MKKHASLFSPPAVLAGILLSTAPLPSQAEGGGTPPGEGIPVEVTAGWAVLQGGRLKPLDTFARDTILALSGRKSMEGMSPLRILWGFHFSEKWFRARPWIRMDSRKLKAAAGLDPSKKRYSFDTLIKNQKFRKIVDRGLSNHAGKQSHSRLEDDALEVYDKLRLVKSLGAEGKGLRIIPPLHGNTGWAAPVEIRDAAGGALKKVYRKYKAFASAWASGDGAAFRAAAGALSRDLKALAPQAYPAEWKLNLELLYNRLSPFFWAWILYLLAFLAFTLLAYFRPGTGGITGNILLAGGFLFHSSGIALRWIIGGRAPLANMYESLVFMGWGVLALGLVMGFLHRKRVFPAAASVLGLLSLVFAQNLPLDSSINPLLPVLAHTYWLSLHVITVMISYSAFALAMGLGHVVLGVMVFKPGRTDLSGSLSRLIFKTTQVGLLFLAAGIVTGAIWANQSWGRYWGWDPKETWSLITFFIYLLLVHARFAGWLKDFGLALFSVLGFLGVLMTYYGVNFVLGTGLHSYGAAEGGLLYVSLFVGLELLLVGWAFLEVRKRSRQGEAKPGESGA